MDANILIGLVSLAITALSLVGGGVWIVATVKATTSQLVKAVEDLTAGTKELAGQVKDIEHDHADTRERVARLEGSNR